MTDLREHGDPSRPNYAQYHPNAAGQPQPDWVAEEWEAPHDDEVSAAIAEYTNDGYMAVNEALRYGGDGRAMKQADLMRTALRPMPEAADLGRGTTFTAFESLGLRKDASLDDALGLLTKSVGAIVSDKAFASTSRTMRYWDGTVWLQLAAPAGTMAIDAENWSASPGEREVILGPDTKWRIDDVTKKKDTIVVHGTVVP